MEIAPLWSVVDQKSELMNVGLEEGDAWNFVPCLYDPRISFNFSVLIYKILSPILTCMPIFTDFGVKIGTKGIKMRWKEA